MIGLQTSRWAEKATLAFTCGLLVTGLLGCQASMQGRVTTAESSTFTTSDESFELESQQGPFTDEEEDAWDDAAPFSGGTKAVPALLGARHDLSLTPGTAPTCSCMAFAVGDPSDGRFSWEGQRPVLGGDSSVVVAFSMVDGECAAEQVASYKGYKVVGNDVHVLLELSVEGRPRLFGAVLPRPLPGGSLVVAPPPDAPFGHSRNPSQTTCVLAEGAQATPGGQAASGARPAEVPTQQTHGLQRVALHDTQEQEVPTAEEFASTPSDIPDDDSSHSNRDGFHLSMLLGAEYPIAQIQAGPGLSGHEASGLGMGFDLLIGGNPKPDMAVGIMIGGSSVPDPELDVGGEVAAAEEVSDQRAWELEGSTLTLSGSRMNLFRVGAFVDYYFSPDWNWHGLLMLGYANLSFSGNDVPDSLSGFAATAGVGYDVWLSHHWSLGVMARLLWSPMSSTSQESTVHLISPSLGLSLAFH